MAKKVNFLIKGVSFRGTIYEPANLSEARGIIIFTHGLGYCERQYKIDDRYLTDNGYLLVTYNLRGHGGNKSSWTLKESADDLVGIVTQVLEKYNFKNNQRIAVMGHSTGALITLLACLKDKRIQAASIVTIVTCLRHSFLHWFESGYNQEVKKYFTEKGVLPSIIKQFLDDKKMLDLYDQKKIPLEQLEVPHRYGMLRSSSFSNFFYEIGCTEDIMDYADKLAVPILFFRGEYDEVMNPQKTVDLYNKIGNKTKNKLLVTKSRDHFQNDSWDFIETQTVNFLNGLWNYSPLRIKKTAKSVLSE